MILACEEVVVEGENDNYTNKKKAVAGFETILQFNPYVLESVFAELRCQHQSSKEGKPTQP